MYQYFPLSKYYWVAVTQNHCSINPVEKLFFLNAHMMTIYADHILTRLRLKLYEVGPHLLGGLGVVANLSVGVKTKHFWGVDEG